MSFIANPSTFATVLKFGLGSMLLISAALYTQHAYAELPPMQHEGAVEYVSGGIGLDESTAFKAAMPQFPLALTFASSIDAKAAYVSDVQVVIRDSADHNVLNVTSQGPYLLAKLPNGQYQVFATYKAKTLSQKISVNGPNSAQAIFEWKN